MSKSTGIKRDNSVKVWLLEGNNKTARKRVSPSSDKGDGTINEPQECVGVLCYL